MSLEQILLTIILSIIVNVIAPLIKGFLSKDRNKAEAAVIDANAAERLKDTAADQAELALKQAEKLSARLDQVEMENAKLRAQNLEIMRELAAQQIINERIKAENLDLKRELDIVKAENESLKKDLSYVRSENETLKTRVKELENAKNNHPG